MQTIFLEFHREHQSGLAALGTDTVFGIDGRWSAETTRDKIADRVRELRSGPFAAKYQKLLFAGYTISGREGELHVSLTDTDPPAWAQLTGDMGGGRYWKWLIGGTDAEPVVFAQAVDEKGEDFVDECWMMHDVHPRDLTVQHLRAAAMSFEAAYGEPA